MFIHVKLTNFPTSNPARHRCGSAHLGTMVIHKAKLRAWTTEATFKINSFCPAALCNATSATGSRDSRCWAKPRLRRLAAIQPSKFGYFRSSCMYRPILIYVINRWGWYSRLLVPFGSSTIFRLYRRRRGERGIWSQLWSTELARQCFSSSSNTRGEKHGTGGLRSESKTPQPTPCSKISPLSLFRLYLRLKYRSVGFLWFPSMWTGWKSL